jgi:hypothetical protein
MHCGPTATGDRSPFTLCCYRLQPDFDIGRFNCRDRPYAILWPFAVDLRIQELAGPESTIARSSQARGFASLCERRKLVQARLSRLEWSLDPAQRISVGPCVRNAGVRALRRTLWSRVQRTYSLEGQVPKSTSTRLIQLPFARGHSQRPERLPCCPSNTV